MLARVLVVFALTLGAACDEDTSIPLDSCRQIQRHCSWNEKTGDYDKDCKYIAPPDGGPGARNCDGGPPVTSP